MQKSNATAGLLGVASALVLLTSALGAQSQTPGNGAAPSLPPVVSASDYRLAPGDKLRVEVYKDAQLSQSLQIRPDGKVTLPLLGDIVAADLTPIQLRDRIATQLKEYVTNPVVTVIVVEASPAMVYVMGEVGQPGSIPMRGPMTVLQALAMAGGFRSSRTPRRSASCEGVRQVDGRSRRSGSTTTTRSRATLPPSSCCPATWSSCRKERRNDDQRLPLPRRVVARCDPGIPASAASSWRRCTRRCPSQAQSRRRKLRRRRRAGCSRRASASAEVWDNNVLLSTEGSETAARLPDGGQPPRRARVSRAGARLSARLSGAYQLYQQLRN